MTRRSAGALIALVLGALLILGAAPQEPAASAGTPHRAAVVVDLGDGHVNVGCVSFTEDHISGLEALDRAAMSPVAQTFSGQGAAVCAICGKGCTAGSSCLTCKAPNYWAYFHDGTYSRVAASATQVRDGDTEGWKWGKGEAPARVPFSQVCAATGPPPTPASTTTRPAASSPGPSFPSPTRAQGSGGVPTAPGQGAARGGWSPAPTTIPGSASLVPSTSGPSGGSGTTAPGSSSTSSLGAAKGQAPSTTRSAQKPSAKDAPTDRSAAAEETASARRRNVVIKRVDATRKPTGSGSNTSGSPVLSIAGFLAAIAVVGGLVVVVRRRRRTPA